MTGGERQLQCPAGVPTGGPTGMQTKGTKIADKIVSHVVVELGAFAERL